MNDKIVFLGQADFSLCRGGTVVFIDPYLSNSVAETGGAESSRMADIAVRPEKLRNKDLMAITNDLQIKGIRAAHPEIARDKDGFIIGEVINIDGGIGSVLHDPE
jgi:hypothetical protein